LSVIVSSICFATDIIQKGEINPHCRSVDHHKTSGKERKWKMAKKEDEIQTIDPGEKEIPRRVRHNSINSGKPNCESL